MVEKNHGVMERVCIDDDEPGLGETCFRIRGHFLVVESEAS